MRAALGLDRESDLVTGPHNVLGIELNEYAAELARVTVWIGELQWRLAHGYEFKTNPVLEPLDHIECRDALLVRFEPGAREARTPEPHTLCFLKSTPTSAPPAPLSASGTNVEATQESGVRSEFRRDASPKTATMVRNSALTPVSGATSEIQVAGANWPRANVTIGNTPFLGDKMMRSELGGSYTDMPRRWCGKWTIDFGTGMTEGDAALFEMPFEYATRHIKSIRATNREAQRAKNWWRHGRPRPELRSKLVGTTRYIATVETAKHRFFVFFPVSVAPEHSLIVIPRADDKTFGLLSSRMHVL